MAILRSLVWNVYKDLYLMRRALAFYSLTVVAFAALYSGRTLTPLLAVVAASVVMAPSRLACTEERSGGLVLQRTLPVSPRVVVGAKYVDVLLVACWLDLLAVAAAMAGGTGGLRLPAGAGDAPRDAALAALSGDSSAAVVAVVSGALTLYGLSAAASCRALRHREL